MFSFNRDNFRVDTLLPIVQAAAAVVTTSLMTTRIFGHLGHHIISFQSALVLSTITAFAAAVIENFIENVYLKYLSIPLGFAVAVVAHRVIYPGINWNHVIDPKGTIAILFAITLVKVIWDNWHLICRVNVDGKKVEIEVKT